MHRYLRLLRTATSERFLIQSEGGVDLAAVDLHYHASGSVAGTVTVIEGEGTTPPDVPSLLQEIDELLLPHVSLDKRNLVFTVVRGRVEGDYVPESSEG